VAHLVQACTFDFIQAVTCLAIMIFFTKTPSRSKTQEQSQEERRRRSHSRRLDKSRGFGGSTMSQSSDSTDDIGYRYLTNMNPNLSTAFGSQSGVRDGQRLYFHYGGGEPPSESFTGLHPTLLHSDSIFMGHQQAEVSAPTSRPISRPDGHDTSPRAAQDELLPQLIAGDLTQSSFNLDSPLFNVLAVQSSVENKELKKKEKMKLKNEQKNAKKSTKAQQKK